MSADLCTGTMLGAQGETDEQRRERRAFSPRSSLLTPYLPALFDPPAPVLLPQHRPLVQLWDAHLERARWSVTEPSQADFEETLRILAIILAELTRQGRTAVPTAAAASGSSSDDVKRSRETLASDGG
jgi:hypothetical protein